jgi:hypothetical protein
VFAGRARQRLDRGYPLKETLGRTHLATNYRIRFLMVAVIILSALLLLSCGTPAGSSAGGVISEVTMATGVAKDGRPIGATSVFPQNAKPFYCSFKLSKFPLDTKMSAQLIYIGPGKSEGTTDNATASKYAAMNYVMETQSGILNKGSGYAAIVWKPSPSPGYVWPKGDYKVIIYLVVDQPKETASVSFKVQ